MSFMIIESHRCIDLSLSPYLHRSQLTAHLFLESLGLVRSRLMQQKGTEADCLMTVGLWQVSQFCISHTVSSTRSKLITNKYQKSELSKHHCTSRILCVGLNSRALLKSTKRHPQASYTGILHNLACDSCTFWRRPRTLQWLIKMAGWFWMAPSWFIL